ncbi:MAG: universal stress protein [Pseudomonadota bacterium]
MFKHILVPADGSDNAQRAVDKAISLAKAFDSEVSIIYVIDPYAFTGVGTDFSYGQAEYLSAATAEGNQALEATRAAFEAAGVSKVNSAVVEGHAVYKGILESAAKLGADLIVMGSHGKRGLEKLVLGSVTSQVLSHAHLPVLVVRD